MGGQSYQTTEGQMGYGQGQMNPGVDYSFTAGGDDMGNDFNAAYGGVSNFNGPGSLNESYFQEILDGQLRSVEYKVSIGSLEFGEPEPESNYVPPEV